MDEGGPLSRGPMVVRAGVLGLVAGLIGGFIAFYVAASLYGLTPKELPGKPRKELPPRGEAGRAPQEQGFPLEPPSVDTAKVSPAVGVAERVSPAIVGVTSEEILRDFWTRELFAEPIGSGSGVVFDKEGYIVTNYHVIQNADRVRVVLPGGRDVPARVRGVDPPTDLAVLKIEPTAQLSVAVFADSDKVKVGELAIAIGNPLGMEFARSVTVGVVSGIRSLPYGQGQMRRVFKLIQTDAAINPGNSGGALVNAAGQVIGINTFKISEQENVTGMGFAIPSNTVKRVTADLVKYGRVRRAVLGVTFMTREEAQYRYGIDVSHGVPIRDVARRSPADQAGLEPGDVILALDGVAINDFVDAIRILEMKRPGERLVIRFRRDGREQEVTVILAEMQ